MEHLQERIQFIQKTERVANTLLSFVKTKDIANLLIKEKEIMELAKYYESDAWKKDYEMERQNMFPKDLKRGILSEDFLYNLLSDIETLRKEMEHEYLYCCGVIDAFNEVVKAGVKDLALSHPSSQVEIEKLIPYAKIITEKYQTKYEVEPNLLITDLFPYSANRGKTVILFYKKEEIIQKYHALKKQKEEALKNNTYEMVREEIARNFGKLLSYSDESIANYIETNTEKE